MEGFSDGGKVSGVLSAAEARCVERCPEPVKTESGVADSWLEDWGMVVTSLIVALIRAVFACYVGKQEQRNAC